MSISKIGRQLHNAGVGDSRSPNLEASAAELGVTVSELQEIINASKGTNKI
jgi:hypothetical protein